MGSVFKFGEAVLEMFEFQCSKKWFFLDKDLKGTYTSFEIAPKKKIFKVCFCSFWRTNTRNFHKIDPKFENKSLFNAKCYGT